MPADVHEEPFGHERQRVDYPAHDATVTSHYHGPGRYAYQASCSCGWRGLKRGGKAWADTDAGRHNTGLKVQNSFGIRGVG